MQVPGVRPDDHHAPVNRQRVASGHLHAIVRIGRWRGAVHGAGAGCSSGRRPDGRLRTRWPRYADSSACRHDHVRLDSLQSGGMRRNVMFSDPRTVRVDAPHSEPLHANRAVAIARRGGTAEHDRRADAHNDGRWRRLWDVCERRSNGDCSEAITSTLRAALRRKRNLPRRGAVFHATGPGQRTARSAGRHTRSVLI